MQVHKTIPSLPCHEQSWKGWGKTVLEDLRIIVVIGRERNQGKQGRNQINGIYSSIICIAYLSKVAKDKNGTQNINQEPVHQI